MKFLRFLCVPGQRDNGKDNKAGYGLNMAANRAVMKLLAAFMMMKEDKKNSAQEQKRGYGQQFFISRHSQTIPQGVNLSENSNLNIKEAQTD